MKNSLTKAEETKKAHYDAPRLVTYGKFEKITKGALDQSTDGTGGTHSVLG